jgi:hypothetical protein
MEQQPPQEPPPAPGSPNVHAALRSILEGLISLTGGKKKSSWLPSEGWIWGLAAVLFAALRLLVVSRGDTETLRALVQNLNVTALVLATILPFGAMISVVLTLSLFVSRKAPDSQRLKGEPFLFLFLIAVTALLVVYAMPVWQIGAIVGLALAVAVVILGVKIIAVRAQKTRASGVPKTPVIILVLVTILAVLFSPIIYLIGWSGMWLPKEHITVADTDVSPIYMLSSDERWTSYMDEERRIHLVPTTDITDRDAVGPSGSRLDKSLAGNISDAMRWVGSICHGHLGSGRGT